MVNIGNSEFAVLNEICYLGDRVDGIGGIEAEVIG